MVVGASKTEPTTGSSDIELPDRGQNILGTVQTSPFHVGRFRIVLPPPRACGAVLLGLGSAGRCNSTISFNGTGLSRGHARFKANDHLQRSPTKGRGAEIRCIGNRNQTMQVLTFNEARAGLKQAMDDVCRGHEPTVITRQRGGHVVLLSLKDFNSMNETIYLLGAASNASRLRESVAQHQAGAAFRRIS